MGMTARFKYEIYLVKEIENTTLGGTYTSRHIILPLADVDFDIARYVERDYNYDIIVVEKDPDILDGGTTVTIINVPKDMITIANKHLKEKHEIQSTMAKK
jgi:hypothetical protein